MPKNQFFGDMTFDHDRLFTKGYNHTNPLYVKIFTKHGAGVSLLHKFAVNKQIENDVAAYKTKNGSTLKYAWDMYSSKFKLTNGAFLFEVKAKPADWNTNDLSFEAKNATNFKTANAAWDNTTSVKAGLPQTGPARLWATFDFVFKNSGDKIIKNSFNAQVNDHFFLGSKIEHNTKDLTAAQFQFAHKEGSDLHYARWNNFNKQLVLGATHSLSCCDKPVFGQLTWDQSGKLQGIQGHPVALKFGSTFKLNDSQTVKSHFACAQQCVL